CANGWVYRFKLRNGLQKVNFSGEANSAPIESLPAERVRLRALLAKYDAEDIYNADETGLFFRMEPNQTLSTGAVAGRKKVRKLFYNMIGSHKLRPLVIGKSLNPRCFKNFNKSALPVIYRANSKAWMRSDIFVEWLRHLDNYFRTLDRKILLLIDNAGSHFNTIRLEENDDDETTNTGKNNSDRIIHSFKAKYKKEFCKHIIRQFDSGIDHIENKLNLKEAIDYIAEGWNNIKTGILPTYDDDNDGDIDEDDLESDLDGDDIEDFLDNLPNSDDIIEYFQMLDHEIPTEENLTDEEIVNLAVSGLKLFINYFEQQDNSEFNIDDLRVFRKYL
ncbi:7440_t:CDS:2, partial [Rhizophagus irregularis]